MSTATPDSAAGWDAITAALDSVYGGREPMHYATLIKYALGGPDPIDGISAYARDDTHPPHFHIVTYGFTELYAKESESTEWSGYGFELTFRVARAATEAAPPAWALNFLQNLARYVFSSGNTFEAGHYVDLNGPIALERSTDIRAIGFALDPELPPRDTPHGKMQFLQVVGLTLDELAAARRWRTDGVLGLLKGTSPLLVTDLARPSLLRDPANRAALDRGVASDGSSCGALFVDLIRVEAPAGQACVITLSATLVRDLVDLLPARLAFGRSLSVVAPDTRVEFEPAQKPGFAKRDGAFVVRLPAAAAIELAKAIVPKRGEYTVPSAPGLRIVVVPATIRDRDGNVLDVVGQ
jgi:hypothetical protein